jgi:hypothetical protein
MLLLPSDRAGKGGTHLVFLLCSILLAGVNREAARGRLREAARYPICGNEDWRIAARLDAEALERAGTAEPAAGDLPGFARLIAVLGDPKLPDSERESVRPGPRLG